MNIKPVSFGTLRITPYNQSTSTSGLVKELTKDLESSYKVKDVIDPYNAPVLKMRDYYQYAQKLDIKYASRKQVGNKPNVYLSTCENANTGQTDIFLTAKRKTEKRLIRDLSDNYIVEDYWEKRISD